MKIGGWVVEVIDSKAPGFVAKGLRPEWDGQTGKKQE